MQWPGRTRAPFETASEKNSVKPRDCCWGAGWGGLTSLGFGWSPRVVYTYSRFTPCENESECPRKRNGPAHKRKEIHLPSTRSFLPFSRARFAQVACFTDFTQLSWGQNHEIPTKRSPEMGLRLRKCLDSLPKLPPSKHLTFGFQSVIFCWSRLMTIYTETDPSNKNVCHLHLIEGAMKKLCPFFVGLFHRQQISGVPASIRSWQSEVENSVCGLISPGVQDMLGTCRFVAVIIQACVFCCLVYATMAGKFWWILRLNLQVASTMASWTRLRKVGSIDLYMGLWYGYTFEIPPNLPFV